MSRVCNVVLLMSIQESIEGERPKDDILPGLDALNAWLKADNGRGELRRVDQYGSNGKCMECNVALGAFNYLDVDRFVAAYRAAQWEDRENVQLLICDQDDDRFTEYSALEPT